MLYPPFNFGYALHILLNHEPAFLKDPKPAARPGTYAMTQHPPLRLIVLMPLRDDWPSAAELIRRLDKAISSDGCTMEIILVDDGSVQRCDRNDFQSGFSVVRAIRTLRLRRN